MLMLGIKLLTGLPQGGHQRTLVVQGFFDRLLQTVQRIGRESSDLHAAVPGHRFALFAVLFQHQVEVATAESERRKSGSTRMLGVTHPGASHRVQIESAVFDTELGVRLFDIDSGREDLVMQSQSSFDEAGRTGRRFGVPDLRLNAAESAPLLVFTGFGVDSLESLELHHVSDLGTGTVGFHHLDGATRDIGILVSATQGARLTGTEGSVNGFVLAVAGSTHSSNHGVHSVSVALGIGQALENYHTQALADQSTVGVGVEGADLARSRESGGFGETHVHENVVECVDTAGNHHVGLAGFQFEESQVRGRERAGAGRVHHTVGTVEVQAVGDTSGDHVAQKTGERVFLPRYVVGGDSGHHLIDQLVVQARFLESSSPHRMAQPGAQRHHQLQGAGDTKNDAGLLSVEFLVRTISRILQRCFRSHQTQQLGGIGRFQHGGRHGKFGGVERIGIQKATSSTVCHIGGVLVGVEIVVRTPMGVRHVADRVHAEAQNFPVILQPRGLGEERRHAHDGDVLPLALAFLGFTHRLDSSTSFER